MLENMKRDNMKQTLMIIAVFLSSVTISTSIYAASKNLGTFGRTYPIAEKDALVEVQDKAKTVDWGQYFSKEKWEKKIKGFKPQDLVSLPKATKNSSYLVDPTYTLDFDVPMVDQQGNIIGTLYPKGYQFNPLEYFSVPNIMVFLDGTDKNQLVWIKDSPYLKDARAILIITDGTWFDVGTDLNMPVYYARKPIVDRLQVKAVPSVVYQEGRNMRIQEINADEYVAKKRARP